MCVRNQYDLCKGRFPFRSRTCFSCTYYLLSMRSFRISLLSDGKTRLSVWKRKLKFFNFQADFFRSDQSIWRVFVNILKSTWRQEFDPAKRFLKRKVQEQNITTQQFLLSQKQLLQSSSLKSPHDYS